MKFKARVLDRLLIFVEGNNIVIQLNWFPNIETFGVRDALMLIPVYHTVNYFLYNGFNQEKLSSAVLIFLP